MDERNKEECVIKEREPPLTPQQQFSTRGVLRQETNKEKKKT